MTEIERIAKGLTKAQRSEVIRMADVWHMPDLRTAPALVARGLARKVGKTYAHELTPIGQQVRAHIKEQSND